MRRLNPGSFQQLRTFVEVHERSCGSEVCDITRRGRLFLVRCSSCHAEFRANIRLEQTKTEIAALLAELLNVPVPTMTEWMWYASEDDWTLIERLLVSSAERRGDPLYTLLQRLDERRALNSARRRER
jgi:hypothetical protein